MLKPDQIPNKEPLIRVGLILPEDNIQFFKFSFSDSQCYEIEISDRLLPSCKNFEKLTLKTVNQNLFIPELSIESQTIKVRASVPDDNPFIKIEDVPAGRSFHWEKIISPSYWGSLEFSISNGNLMVVNELPLETYLKCVATSEMSAQCPPEFLKAQTIVARSWLLANTEKKHHKLGFDICNDDCCQRYQGMTNNTTASIQSTDTTFGQVIMFNKKICDSRYSKSCGGITENYEHVWDGDPIPYLISLKDVNSMGVGYCSPEIVPESLLNTLIGSVDEKGQYYRWTYEVKNKELVQSLEKKMGLKPKKILELNPVNTGRSGRITNLSIQYEDRDGLLQNVEIHSEYEIRRIMSPSFLYSSAFNINKNDNGNFVLKGKGWGHGVGLCQIGALGMAISKKNTNSILTHYYPGTHLTTIYNK
jgi:SpoIID/LytB domain protein